MKDDLAEALLGKTMGWTEDALSKERFRIQMLSEIKYDGYQQYSQGMKYVESLALWLNCFSIDDREIMYDFIKSNLVFISEKQMRQLIDISFHYYIKPVLINEMKAICKSNGITGLEDKKSVYRCVLRQSLFLGLSDGAHIDIFRRDHPFLSNEQINIHYDFSSEKVADIKKELEKSLKEYPDTIISNEGFRNIFLLDDFSASGISFIRKEGNEWKGKITKFLKQLKEYGFDYEKINIYVVLYVATSDAIGYINNALAEYKEELKLKIELKATAIQYIEKHPPNEDVLNALKKYYQQYEMEEIEDKHYRKGFKKGEPPEPYLGFNKCSLPLVIYHNTPNNTFPIIWFEKSLSRPGSPKFKGLFPRVKRHKEEN